LLTRRESNSHHGQTKAQPIMYEKKH
jgi:hypothetical protein